MFVENEPFPSCHCVCDVGLVSSIKEGFDFLLVCFDLLPDLLEGHECITF
jgi:hypothetical protein